MPAIWYYYLIMKQEFSQSQLELKAYIEEQNSIYQKQAAAARLQGKDYIVFELTSDPAHWAEQGIYTVDQFDFQMALSAYSDSYKEVNGMRPDLSGFKTLREVEVAMAGLDRQWAEQQMENSREAREHYTYFTEFCRLFEAYFGFPISGVQKTQAEKYSVQDLKRRINDFRQFFQDRSLNDTYLEELSLENMKINLDEERRMAIEESSLLLRG